MRLRLCSLAAAVASLVAGPACGRTKQEKQGAELYGRMCAVCHGADGEGYKADMAPKLRDPEFLGSASDPFLRESIVNGRLGSTMSAWGRASGGPLTDPEVDAIIAFMRLWREKKPVPLLDERVMTGDPKRGATLYAQECARCHGVTGNEGPNGRLANAGFLANASNGFIRLAIRNGRAGTSMAAFASKLGNQGVEDVLSFMRSWTTRPVARANPPPNPPPVPLGPVPLNPKGPEPEGFKATPGVTSADVVKAQLDRGAKLAILDARAPSDFLKERIKGAVSVPFYDPGPYLDKLPRDAWLVCYCACPHAESKQLAQKLKDKGFTKVTVLDEGLPYWRNKGWPIEKP